VNKFSLELEVATLASIQCTRYSVDWEGAPQPLFLRSVCIVRERTLPQLETTQHVVFVGCEHHKTNNNIMSVVITYYSLHSVDTAQSRESRFTPRPPQPLVGLFDISQQKTQISYEAVYDRGFVASVFCRAAQIKGRSVPSRCPCRDKG
jgi:hypothetical protein